MSGGSLRGYTQLAYMDEDIDRELETLKVSERSQQIISQMKLLYWEMYKLTKSLDYWVSGDHNEEQFQIDWNYFRSKTGIIPREDT